MLLHYWYNYGNKSDSLRHVDPTLGDLAGIQDDLTLSGKDHRGNAVSSTVAFRAFIYVGF